MEVKKPNIWIFSIEPLESRYTQQWYDHVPTLLADNLGDQFNIVQIDGIQKNTSVTPGAFLNFSDTNYWKSSQLCNFLDQYNSGLTTPNDQFIFTDAWNPTIIQIKYMNDLLSNNWIINGLWHAGSYDKWDFLGRLVGDKPWVNHTEQALFHAIDHNYFATYFHIELFARTHGDQEYPYDWVDSQLGTNKIVRTGWPMEYMASTLSNYQDTPKRDLILFPHRIAPEKQVDIFRDIAASLPQYEFIVCQDKSLTKDAYHKLLAESKIVFSASLQETLGISPYEGAIVGAIPLMPSRLSYPEMYHSDYLYPSLWTKDWESYLNHKDQLIAKIIACMTDYDRMSVDVATNILPTLTTEFFSANKLIRTMSDHI